MQSFELGNGVMLHHGDNRDVLASLPDASIDSVVTDPPYALNFMGKGWDSGAIVHDVAFWAECLRVLKPGGHIVAFSGTRTYHRMTVAIEDAGFEVRDQLAWCFGVGFPKSHNQGNGWGTALKPAWEPVCLARKPLIGTVAANVLAHGTGAINIDGCRVETDDRLSFGSRQIGDGIKYNPIAPERMTPGEQSPFGRWPANLVHDGSAEVVGMFPVLGKSQGGSRGGNASKTSYALGAQPDVKPGFGDSGSAARFFYSAKASKADRAGSKHPTVKPVALMQWLCRLITPPGGTILDPFAGSGTTGAAAQREGFKAILCEREDEYVADIQRRFAPEPFELTA